MAKLVMSAFTGSSLLWVYLNEELILQNSNSQTKDIVSDEHHVLHWFVKGEPGSSYSITISAPGEAQFQLTKVIGKAGVDFGGFPFKA